MNKKELAAAVADTANISKEKATEVVDALFTQIERSLKHDEQVKIQGFGTFKLSKRKARTARNPQTGAEMHLPATKVPRFTAAKSLKDAVAD